MSDLEPSSSWREGYAEQSAWLEGKTLSEAETALAGRLGSLEDGEYNRGGTQATADYIERERGRK